MQLAIDINNETPQALRLAAQFLIDHAALREAMEGAGQEMPTARPPAPPAPPASPVDHATAVVPPTPPPPPPVSHAHVPPAPAASPAAELMRVIASNTEFPFLPAPPAAPPAATGPASASSAAPDAANAPPAPNTPPAGTALSAEQLALVGQVDKSGVPYDARIHQRKGNKKKDGTWKLQKGIDPAIVAAVMQELSGRIQRAPSTPAPVGASAPVSLQGGATESAPQAPAPGAVPPPPPPAVYDPNAAAVPPAPPAAPPVQAPISTPGAQGQGVDPYRSLVTKIVKARELNRITADEVTQCVAAQGVPSLQALNAAPHLIAAVEAAIDAILATR